MAKLNKNCGYAVLELNQVAFPRDGRVEAQLPLDEDVFSAAKPAECGMILKVDKVNGKITLPSDSEDGFDTYALNYTTEHMYDERTPQLNAYATFPGEFYPRLGYLSVGDRFTTNCVADDYDVDYLVTAGTDGYWIKYGETNAVSNAPIARVVEKTTCPNGVDPAVKLMVVKA